MLQIEMSAAFSHTTPSERHMPSVVTRGIAKRDGCWELGVAKLAGSVSHGAQQRHHPQALPAYARSPLTPIPHPCTGLGREGEHPSYVHGESRPPYVRYYCTKREVAPLGGQRCARTESLEQNNIPTHTDSEWWNRFGQGRPCTETHESAQWPCPNI